MKTTKLLLKIFFSLFLVYGLFGFFVLPGIIKEQLVENLEKVVARKIDLDAVSFNPYTFELNIHEFVIHEQTGDRTFAGAKEIDINIDPLALVVGHVKVKLIEITAPHVTIHKNQECGFNFSDLLVTDEKSLPEEKRDTETVLPKILVNKFSIIHGEVNFIDESGSEPFEASLKPIDFRLYDFSTMEEHNNQLSLHVEIDDGAYIDYRGKLNSLDPLRLEGGLELHSGRLYTQWKYFRDSLGFIVADGALDASLHYSADLSADPMQININQYKLQIDNLRLQDLTSKEDVLKLPLLTLGGDADITSQQINVNEVKVDGFSLKVSRDKRGALNWATYFPPSEPKSQKDEIQEKSPWKVDIAKVDIQTDRLTYEENYAQAPFTAGLEHLIFGIKDARLHGDNLIVDHFDTNLSEFSLIDAASEKKWMDFKTFTLNGQLQKDDAINLDIEQVGLDKLDVYALMDKEGVLNFSRLTSKSGTKSTDSEAEPLAVTWKVKSFKLSDSKVDFKDKFNAVDGLIQLDRINVALDDLSSTEGSWAESSVSLRLNKTGVMRVQSQIRHTPLMVKSDFTLKDLDLVSFQPYVEKRANMDIKSGKVDLDFKAKLQAESTKVLANTRIRDLNFLERREGKTFFAFKKLLVKDIDFSLKPDRIKIAEVNIYEPYARMKVDTDKHTNLDMLMLTDPDASKEAHPSGKPFAVFVGKVNFKDGKGEFSDLSLPLPFKTDIHDLNGNMLALGTMKDVNTIVDIDGVVDEYGLAKIKGGFLSADPKIFTDIQLKFQNIDMTNLSPYTGKFIGYELKEGKMNVELDYKIDASQMQGGNRVVLKRLTLGEEVESDDAISAPVGLAIALLKDSEGVIDLDVPVTGNVDEPEFAIGHVVWTAFKNLIVGVATAPFNFLGEMLGISAEELENIAFEPGKSNLLPPEREKLDKLSEALSSKKMLILNVAGSYDDSRDLMEMKIAKLYKEALLKLEDNTTDLSLMDKDDLDDLLKELYMSHFGEESFELEEEKIEKLDLDSDAKKSELRRLIKDTLVDTQNISAEDLAQLGQKRAQAIVSHLVSKGIDVSRLEVMPSVKSDAAERENEYVPTKLELGAR